MGKEILICLAITCAITRLPSHPSKESPVRYHRLSESPDVNTTQITINICA